MNCGWIGCLIGGKWFRPRQDVYGDKLPRGECRRKSFVGKELLVASPRRDITELLVGMWFNLWVKVDEEKEK